MRLVRVRSHQTDLNGAMYHGAYLDVFDDARIDTFRDLGYTYEDALEGGWRLVIRRIACEYHRPAMMDDLIQIAVHVDEMTRATLTLRFECRRDDSMLALGHTTYVFVDGQGKPLRFPADLRDLIETHAELLRLRHP